MVRYRLLEVAIIAAVSANVWAQQIPAFPGAQGFGSTTPGGRGGDILFVTSLDDTGPGTLRDAVEDHTGPRTVLFRVSGLIQLETPLEIGGRWKPEEGGDNPYSYLTIAGQSAPGGGVCIAGREVRVSNDVHDVVLRNLRVRSCSGWDGDAMGVYGGAHDVIVDHCSMSWAVDENVDMSGYVRDLTLSNCISEACLWFGGHSKGSGHSMGLLSSYDADRISIHHSFFTANNARNPQVCGGNVEPYLSLGLVKHPVYDLRNNVVYNWGQDGTLVRCGAYANVVGCVFKAGPDSIASRPLLVTDAEDGGSLMYADDIIAPNLTTGENLWSVVRVDDKLGQGEDGFRASQPFQTPPVTTIPASELAARLLPFVGAYPHDATDRRLVREYWDGTGEMGAASWRDQNTPVKPPLPGEPAPDDDMDGMPNGWETAHGLDPQNPGDAWQDRDGDGYPNLEEYLNSLIPKMYAAE